jgi:preprotein translocase subunit SecY
MVNITIAGSAFLVIIATLPMLMATKLGLDWTIASIYGGTGILIVVSVALDLVNRVQDQLVMRSYQGFMRRSTVR